MRHSLQSVGFALLLAVGPYGVSEAQLPETVDVLIGFRELPEAAEEALVRAAGGRILHVYHLVPAMAASVPVSALDGLSRSPQVTVIEPDGQVQAIDAELDAAWGVSHIGAGVAHGAGELGDGVRVGIVDTGIDYTHPDLAGNYGGGWDFYNNDSDPMDDHGHGTHVGGTVAAMDNQTGVVGVAPAALLYGIKVLSASGSGSWSGIIAGIEWSADNGIQITNNSYGASGYPGSIVEAAFDNAYAAGVLHVAANGNSGSCAGTGDSVGYPAKFTSVVGVAATNQSDGRACFSSTGPDSELAAPGVSVYSTRAGGGYTTMSGTSMASPHAAGVAALVMGAGILDPAEVRQRLIDTADDLGDPGHDNWFGHGLVDAAEASNIDVPVNQPPGVTVLSPADGADIESGTSAALTASASDPEDGTMTDVDWTSSRDGYIGTGDSLNVVLSDGDHTLTATVTDSGGRSTNDSVAVTVSAPSPPPPPPPEPGTSTVSSVTYQGRGGRSRDKHVDVLVAVTDGKNPVAGASVSVVVMKGSSLATSASGVTDAAGYVIIALKNVDAGCYVTTVTDVQASGLTWDGVTPGNEYCKY